MVTIQVKNILGQFRKRNCPECNKELFYSTHSNYLRAIKNNSICIFCLNRNKLNDPDYIKKLSISKMGDKNPSKRLDVREKISISGKGKHKHTEEFKKKISNIHRGKVISNITKEKMRTAVLNKIKKYGRFARNFNPNACKFIDSINQKTGWRLQHALNGGEKIVCGYSVDGYDTDKNIVLEYDENRNNHFDINGNLKSKDIIRMNNIIQFLKCRFLRYNEKIDRILEYDLNGFKNINIV